MCDGGDGGDGDGGGDDTGSAADTAQGGGGSSAVGGDVGGGIGSSASISDAISAGQAQVAAAEAAAAAQAEADAIAADMEAIAAQAAIGYAAPAGASSGQSAPSTQPGKGALLNAFTMQPAKASPTPVALPAPPAPPGPIMSEEVVDEETGETAMVEVAHASVNQGQSAAAAAAIAAEDQVMQAAYNEGLLEVTPQNVTIAGDITQTGHHNIMAPIGSNPVAMGSYSVAGNLGANSEVAQAMMAANPNSPHASIGVTASDIAALSAQAVDPSTGQMVSVVNIPNPPMGTPAFNQAVTSSYIAGALNPEMSAAISTIGMALMPGPMGMIAGAMQAAQADEMGLPPPGGLFSAFGSITDSSALTSLSNAANAAQIAVGHGIGDLISGVLGPVSDFLDDTLGAGLNNLDAAITDAGVSAGLFDAVDPDTAAETAAAIAESNMGAEDIGDLGGGEVDELPTPAPVVEEPRPDTRPAATVVSEVDTFLDTSAMTSLVSIPDVVSISDATTPTLGVDEDLGVAPMLSTLPRGSSFRRSRVTSPRDRAFGAANLFRPTLSAGISL